MTQADMERELSAMTGESLTTIRRHGFQPLVPPIEYPRTVDWDALDEERVALLPQPASRCRRAA